MEKARKVPEVRRVIGGLAYDTTTASVQYHWHADDNDDPRSYGYDIGSILFLNKWNVYFVLIYDHHSDPTDPDWERIVPLTHQQAVDWAEKHCPWLVEELFGKMPEAGEGQPYAPVGE